MKYHKLIFWVGLIALIGSCRKDDNLKSYPELRGDYNWELSYFEDFTTIHKEDIDVKFGLRIKKRQKIEIYRNGELEMSGEIVAIQENAIGEISFTANFGAVSHSFGYSEDQIRSTTYPFDAIYNIYSKQ